MKRELGLAGVILAGGLVYLMGALRIPHPGVGYAAVGPRAFPFSIAVGLLLCGIWQTLDAIHRKRSFADGAPLDWSRWGSSLLLLFAYVLLLKPIGYLGATAVYFWAQARLLGSRYWARDLFWAAALSLSIYFLFKSLLRLPLPAGLLG